MLTTKQTLIIIGGIFIFAIMVSAWVIYSI